MNTLDKFNEALPVFNYSVLSDEEKLKTLENEKRLDEIFNKYRPEIGEVLYDQQQVLANHHKGVFAEWYKSKGFKRWKVYDYINKYKYVLRISEDPEKLEMFDDIPSSLQSEMAKPSAIPEVNQKVFEGDITAHKDYKEIEMHYQQQLKEQAESHKRQLAEKDEVINKTYEQLEKAQQEPTVIEKEVIPDDYEQVKQENEQLKQSNQKLQRDLKWVRDDLSLTQTQYNLLESSTAEAKELERKIQSLQSQEKTIVEKMEAVETFYELERNFNDFFDTKMAPMRFKGIANHLYATNAVDRIRSMITQAELWAEEMNKILPNKNMKILEGEIIND